MIGETVGSYRITAALGMGGVGEVFAAEHTGTGDKVNVEIVAPQIAANAEALAKFLEGMQKLITVKHAGLIKVIETGTAANHTFVVSAPVDGEPLSKRIETLGRLSLTQIGEVGRQVANALAAVHDEGLVHGDLRPGCIFLLAQGGLARGEPVKINDVGAALAKRASGVLMGPVYQAPEVWSANATDWRIDAYALGCVVFEMATGQPPYIGKSPEEVRAKHLSARSPSARALMPDVPPSLDVMLGRLLSKTPEDRYGSMREIARAFDSLTAGATRSLAPTATDTPVFKMGETDAAPPTDSGVMSGELKARSVPPPDAPRIPETQRSVVAEGAITESAPKGVPVYAPSPAGGDTALIPAAKSRTGLVVVLLVIVLLIGGGIALAVAL